MNILKTYIYILSSLFLILLPFQPAFSTSLSQEVFNVIDTNPDPKIFEAALSADEQDVTIDSTTVHALIYKDDNRPGGYPALETNGIPIPQITVNVGDTVIVKLTNNIQPGCAALACDSSIHWHGLELDGDSDGTGVTQNHLIPGEEYIYRFIPPRPGVFWFHTHMLPGPQTFAGMYGVFIVKDPNEATLQADSKIPPEINTHTVVLSDIEFDADGDVGYLDNSMPPQAIPWATLTEECATMGTSCQKVANGATVLVNGQKPTATTPMITARSGDGIRLRLLNLSTNRYFRLGVTGNGADNNLYRIGGEGGFLEKVRLEGGTLGTWDTKYNKGEIVVVASGRSDVVVVPTGSDGDIITITSSGYVRGGPPGNNDPAGDLLYILIDNNPPVTPFAIAEGNDILGAGGVDNLKSVVISDFYTNPIPNFDANPGAGLGSFDQTIRLEGIMAGQLAIDGVTGHFEDSGPDFTQVPYQNATRYALTGDTLEFTISNRTNQHHPFHHHGFSFQPVRVIDNGADQEDTADDTILYEYDYNEFVDVIDVFGAGGFVNQSIVVRMRLDDRPRITDNRQEVGAPAPNQFFGSGGAKGRWVFHCHLFLHATIGMISELVVLDTDRDGDGVTTEFDCDDFDPMVTNCNTPPTADAGVDQTAECASHEGTVLVMDGTGSSDPEMDILTYLWTAPGIVFDDPTDEMASATFPLGNTIVTLTVSDGEFDDTDEMSAEVEDTIAPVINLSVNPDVLWPPNHKLRNISATVNVTDTCDANPTFALTSVISNEPDNDKGDGNTTGDITGATVGTADVEFKLRAERDGRKSGREYTATYTGSDGSGNESSASATVSVPHKKP